MVYELKFPTMPALKAKLEATPVLKDKILIVDQAIWCLNERLLSWMITHGDHWPEILSEDLNNGELRTLIKSMLALSGKDFSSIYEDTDELLALRDKLSKGVDNGR